MVGPMIPEESLKALRPVFQGGMRHTVVLLTPVKTRLPNGEYTTAWQDGTAQRGLLMMGGAKAAEIAAARGVEGAGTLRLELGAPCAAGQRARVTGTTRGVVWERVVAITSAADQTNRLFGLATVVDVALNQ